MYQLSNEQKDGILAYLNGEEGAVLDPDAAQALLGMAAGLGKALVQRNRTLSGENASMKRRMRRAAERKEERVNALVEAGEFEGTGFNSTMVGKAALYQLQCENIFPNRLLFQNLMYGCYCSFLYEKRLRLFIETPQVVLSEHEKRFVPVFWSMSKAIGDTRVPIDGTWWKELAAKSPAIAAFVRNNVLKHARENESGFYDFILRSAPVRETGKLATANGKKAMVVNDKDIYIWKDSFKHLD